MSTKLKGSPKIESWLCSDSQTAHVTINGRLYSLNIDYVPDSHRPWILNVFRSVVEEAHRQGRREKEQEMQNGLRAFLGITKADG